MWTDDDSFEIDGVEYVCCPLLAGAFKSTPGRFCMVKPRAQVESYERLLRDLSPRRVVEVGLFDGASAAFCADIARPEKIVGIDIAERPSAALAEFVSRRGFEDVLAAYWGVDQADAVRLRSIVAAEFDNKPLDLVVDDASHHLAETRATFNCLFPLVRPGGHYLIEDWRWAHALESWRPDELPMTVLVFELILTCAYDPAVVAEVCVSREWTLVRRGDADLGSGAFDVSRRYGTRGRQLLRFSPNQETAHD